jgi:hypothetical protein
VGTATVDVADLVHFELQTIDYVGLGGLLLFLGGGFAFFVLGFFGGFQLLGAGVAQDEDAATAIGRPGEVFDVLRGFSEALSFSAAKIKEPDLGLTLVAFREESDGFAIGAPAGMRGGDAFGGESDGIAAGARDHPDALFVFVGLEDGGLDDVGDGLSVGAQLRVMNFTDLKIVVNGDRARRGRGLLSESE